MPPKSKPKNYLSPEKIELDKINYYIQEEPYHIKVLHQNSPIYLQTPWLPIPFGLDEQFNNFSIKLSLSRKNPEATSFYELIKNIENHHQEYISSLENEVNYGSQIKEGENKDPLLTIKLPFRYRRLETKFFKSDGSSTTSKDLNPMVQVKCNLEMDSIWKFNNKYYAKWKAKQIWIQD